MEDGDLKRKVQSRLLVLATSICFLYYSGAKLETFPVSGILIRLSNENAILEFLWIIWFYYYLRSYQYFLQHGTADYKRALNDSFSHELGHLIFRLERWEFDMLPMDDPVRSSILRLSPVIISKSIDVDPRRFQSLPPQNACTTIEEVHEYLNSPFLKHRYHKKLICINLMRPRKITIKNIGHLLTSPRSWRIRMKVTVYPPSNREELQGRTKYHVFISGSALFHLPRIFLRSIIFRPAFSETYGPMIIGMAPVWYKIFLNRSQFIATLS